MRILALKLPFLAVPFRRKLETMFAILFVFCCHGYSLLLVWFLLFFTRFWWLSLFFLIWTIVDAKACERGGNTTEWMKSFPGLRYLKSYFPAQLVQHPEFHLDPSRNYIFACFPHGLLPYGPPNNIVSHYSEFYQRYPYFQVKVATIPQTYWIPFKKDLALALGGISCSSRSIDFVLSKPRHILLLWPGGGTEVINTNLGRYTFVVKNRKGFVKKALKHGAPLVPVVTFGETELFEHFDGPIAKKTQSLSKKWLGIAPPICKFLQICMLIPRRRRLTTVVGKPIDVTKIQEPTTKDIDDLHDRFVEELVKLFDDYKLFIEDPQNRHLELL